MALFIYFQGLFLSFGVLDYASINLSGDYDLVILCLRLLPVSQFLYDFLFEKKITTNYILAGHFTFFKRYKFCRED